VFFPGFPVPRGCPRGAPPRAAPAGAARRAPRGRPPNRQPRRSRGTGKKRVIEGRAKVAALERTGSVTPTTSASCASLLATLTGLRAGLLRRREPRIVPVHAGRGRLVDPLRGDLGVGQVSDAVLAHAPGEVQRLL